MVTNAFVMLFKCFELLEQVYYSPLSDFHFLVSGFAVVVAAIVIVVVLVLTQDNSSNGDAPWADAFHTGHNRKDN